jgi:hypothetical protein
VKFRDATLLTDYGSPTRVEVASSVRLGHLPAWLKLRLTPHKRRLGAYSHFDALMRLTSGSNNWLDHWGSARNAHGQEQFISEPYPLYREALQEVLRFAELLDLDVTLSATSYHFPTRVVRLTFEPKLAVAR